MAEKSFGVKEINLIGASGTPTIESPNNLNLNAVNVAISTNATIGGNLTVSGTVGIAGTLTYEDVTNVDAVGIVTARDGIFIPDNKKLELGNAAGSGDLRLYHDGNHSYLDDTGTGNLILRSNVFRLRSPNDEEMIIANENGTVKLYHNDNKKLETTSLGVTITGTLAATAVTGDGSGLTGIAVTEAPVTDYTITGDGGNYYFHGGGVDETAGDPDLYLIRGQKYRFNNTTGSSHPFKFRVSSGGSAYTDGITGDDEGVQFFTVPYAAPASIVYQCSIHSGMVGNIYIRGGSSTANISNNANNRVITGGSGGELNGEANLTFDGSNTLAITGPEGGASRIDLICDEGDDAADKVRLVHTSGNEFKIQRTTSHTDSLVITSEGYVRIGGTIGNYPLNVIETSNRTTTAAPTIGLYAKHDGTGNTGVGFGGGINFWGDRNGDNQRQTMGRIMCIADVNSGTNISGALTFETSTAGTPSERLRITSTGKVSLGYPMTTPPSWLHVKGNTYQTLRLENFDGGANGPYIELYNNSASPADDDYTGVISFKNRNSAAEETTYAQIRTQSTDVTDGTEDGVLTFHTRNNGTFGEKLRIDSTGLMYVNGDGVGGRIDATAGNSSIKISDGNGRSSIKVSDPGSGNSYEWELTTDGNFKAPTGNTKGIDFSAKNNLGGATDTTLAHYEEGTWTPSMTNLDVPGHVTTNWATYTRVGRIVTISVKFTVSNSINDASGFGFELPYGPISNRQIVIPAISDRSGSTPFAFNNVNSDHKVYAKALEGYAFQNYNSFSGNYIIVTGSYETDA